MAAMPPDNEAEMVERSISSTQTRVSQPSSNLENDQSTCKDQNIPDPETGSLQTLGSSVEIPSSLHDDGDQFEVKWGGLHDAQDPRNFSKIRKWIIVITLSMSSTSVACDSALYTTTYDQIMREFHCSELMATAGLSTFILGMGIAPLFLSPLSEFYGRRWIYIIALSFSMVWLIVCAIAKNIQTVIIARLLGGLSGAAFLSVAGGSVGDLFDRHELQFPMIIYSGTQFMGPEMGPLIGGFINYYASWHWTFYFMLVWTGAALVATILFVPETYRPVLLRRSAERLQKEKNDNRYHVANRLALETSVLSAVTWSLLRPLQMLVLEPMCLNLCLHSAVLLGILYLFFGAFPLVFTTNHNFNLWQVGLTFLGLAIGILCGIATSPYWRRNYARLVRDREIKGGEQGGSEPEYRLPEVMAGSVLVPIGLFWFGFTTYRAVPWIVPLIGSAVFGMGVFLSFSGTWTFLVDAYPLYAASALAANSFTRSTFGAIFPLFGIQMYKRLGFDWATAVLAFITLAMVPFPYIFFRHGKKIRGQSRFVTAV